MTPSTSPLLPAESRHDTRRPGRRTTPAPAECAASCDNDRDVLYSSAIVEVTDTAAAVARIRHEEAGRPAAERLFEDPFAHLFRGASAADEVSELYLQAPFFREGVRIRTRYIDDGVRSAVGSGVRQVVSFGAGFDCRALRLREMAEGPVTVFEVDFRAQLATKRSVLESAGIQVPAHLRFVSCDLADPAYEAPLSRALAAAGFSPAAPACMIWEGVINYLDDAAIDRGLRFLARASTRGSRLLFNYNTFRFSSASFVARVLAAGFTSVDERGSDELYRGYLGREPPPCGEFYRVGDARLD